jgi:hypothetical protein
VNAIASACFSPHMKVAVAALQFFVTNEIVDDSDDDSDVCD